MPALLRSFRGRAGAVSPAPPAPPVPCMHEHRGRHLRTECAAEYSNGGSRIGCIWMRLWARWLPCNGEDARGHGASWRPAAGRHQDSHNCCTHAGLLWSMAQAPPHGPSSTRTCSPGRVLDLGEGQSARVAGSRRALRPALPGNAPMWAPVRPLCMARGAPRPRSAPHACTLCAGHGRAAAARVGAGTGIRWPAFPRLRGPPNLAWRRVLAARLPGAFESLAHKRHSAKPEHSIVPCGTPTCC
jgi:hypothetical protein